MLRSGATRSCVPCLVGGGKPPGRLPSMTTGGRWAADWIILSRERSSVRSMPRLAPLVLLACLSACAAAGPGPLAHGDGGSPPCQGNETTCAVLCADGSPCGSACIVGSDCLHAVITEPVPAAEV